MERKPNKVELLADAIKDKKRPLRFIVFYCFYTTGHFGERRHQVGSDFHSVTGQRPDQGYDVSTQVRPALPWQPQVVQLRCHFAMGPPDHRLRPARVALRCRERSRPSRTLSK